MTDTPRRPGRPPKPGGPAPTPLRNVRIPDTLWTAAKETAERRGETVSSVITAALERYVARHRT